MQLELPLQTIFIIPTHHPLRVTPTNSSQSDTLQVKSTHSCKTLLHGYFFWGLSLSQYNKVGGVPRRGGGGGGIL